MSDERSIIIAMQKPAHKAGPKEAEYEFFFYVLLLLLIKNEVTE